MREIINYMIEANVALLLFLAFYKLLLARETHFGLMRIYLLSAMLISLCFPLIHLNNSQAVSIPTISQVVPSNWLPEIVITANGETIESAGINTAYDVWQMAGWIYSAGVVIFLTWLIIQLTSFLLTTRKASSYAFDGFKVIESSEDKATFSFFNLIYIGRANELTASEKQQIIIHESVHASHWHSLDILLVTILQIIFWFNPFIKAYKKIFIQLHEFEADARAVENSDVNNYCSLLARVALQSVHFPIASHFNHSLTLKRIEMMRTIKKKIQPWKIVAIAAIIPLTFFIVACQDQVVGNENDLKYLPAEAMNRFETFRQNYPGDTYIVEYDEQADKKLKDLETQYGKAMHIELFSITLKGKLRTFSMLQFTNNTENLQTDDKVFMIVEQQPEYVGGYEALKDFIRQNMKYPEAAAKAGIGGTVYVSTVVNADGSLSDFTVLKGVDASLDAEAVRVVKLLPAWIPGTQNGEKVRTRFTLPFKFDPSFKSNPIPASEISPDTYKMKISSHTAKVNGKTIVEGTVRDENDKPLARTNIIITGTTTGTSSDSEGNFKIELPSGKKQLVFSFIGFESKTIDF